MNDVLKFLYLLHDYSISKSQELKFDDKKQLKNNLIQIFEIAQEDYPTDIDDNIV